MRIYQQADLIRAICVSTYIFSIGLAYGQKTDIVTLNNGDRITGEVKMLDLEILQLKTSYMSVAQIKWHNVSGIYAPDKYFEFELRDKSKLSGSLDSIGIERALNIRSEGGQFKIRTDQVVSIYQVKQKFWRRFSGNVKGGFNYTKASDVLQINYGGQITYTGEVYYGSVDVTNISTQQPEKSTTIKQDISANINKRIRSREFGWMYAANQKNSELGIQNRAMVGAGYGVDAAHTSIARLRVLGGLTGNQEVSADSLKRTNNAEGYLSIDGRIFKYTDPEVYLTTFINYYPSMTVPGRHRIEAEIKLRIEILNNLFIEIQVYDNYDSSPVSATASNNDYGILSSMSYTFGL